MLDYTILEKSLQKSINVGLAGYGATGFQVCSMMWLRTTMNYQFKNGGKTLDTIKLLYKEGGIPRFYRGVSFALIYAPLSRFGDTAVNMGVMSYYDNSDMGRGQKTFISSILAGLWRLTIIPVDSFKSNLQVHGKDGLKIIRSNIKNNGFRSLYNGATASYSATAIGHFPWFYTYNYLQESLPYKDTDSQLITFLRSGTIGFTSSACSDIISNSIRVLKIGKQTGEKQTYIKIIKEVIEKDSVVGLFTRGLKTKLIINGAQGFIFVVIFDKLKKFIGV